MAPRVINTRSCYLLWLHGLAGCGDEWQDFKDIIGQDLPWVQWCTPDAPMRPVSTHGGQMMRGWFDLPQLPILPGASHQGLSKSVAWVHSLLRKAHEAGFPPERIVLGGFSQGGTLALQSGLTYKYPLAGIISVAGWVPAKLPEAAVQLTTPIHIFQGTEDALVTFETAMESAEALRSVGCNNIVFQRCHGLAHTMVMDLAEDISEFLLEHLPEIPVRPSGAASRSLSPREVPAGSSLPSAAPGNGLHVAQQESAQEARSTNFESPRPSQKVSTSPGDIFTSPSAFFASPCRSQPQAYGSPYGLVPQGTETRVHARSMEARAEVSSRTESVSPILQPARGVEPRTQMTSMSVSPVRHGTYGVPFDVKADVKANASARTPSLTHAAWQPRAADVRANRAHSRPAHRDAQTVAEPWPGCDAALGPRQPSVVPQTDSAFVPASQVTSPERKVGAFIRQPTSAEHRPQTVSDGPFLSQILRVSGTLHSQSATRGQCQASRITPSTRCLPRAFQSLQASNDYQVTVTVVSFDGEMVLLKKLVSADTTLRDLATEIVGDAKETCTLSSDGVFFPRQSSVVKALSSGGELKLKALIKAA
mmetsp:Transcript_65184/g.172702  ORF Transcript_65184/g.172702 Transcript_65184/m.172702 type:complete len:592 (-) Transcript_65184:499-2274(-)